MNLCSIKLARSIWLLPVNDLNPRGRYFYNVIAAMLDRYSFAKVPTIEEAVTDPNRLEFVQGLFQNSNGERISVNLTVHSDGLVADTGSSTLDCDDFLLDLLNWLHDEFGYEDHSAFAIKKMYISELYFNMNGYQRMINPALEPFLQSLPPNVVGHGEPEFEVSGVAIGVDPESSFKPAAFRIERAENVPFSENRYYSVGPFQTETHLNLLQELESLLTA